MKYFRTEDRMIIDMGSPKPLISVPLELWNNGFSEFTKSWQKCDYTKEVLENGRILFTIYIGDSYTTKKVCLYHGTKDATHDNWEEFEYYLARSKTKDEGYSYISVNKEDSREWWEFHIYSEDVENTRQRPVLIFDPNIVNELND